MVQSILRNGDDDTSNDLEVKATDKWFLAFAPINAPFACRRLKMFPKFQKEETVLGKKLGQGCFGVVNELSRIRFLAPENKFTRTPPSSQTCEHMHHHSCTNEKRIRTKKWEVQESDLSQDTILSEGSTSYCSLDFLRSAASEAGRSFLEKNCVRRRGGTKRYALKTISWALSNASEDSRQFKVALHDLKTEVYFLAALEHPHIVKLRGLSNGDMNHRDFFHIVDCLVITLEDQIKIWKRQEIKLKKKGFTKAKYLVLSKWKNMSPQRIFTHRLKIACDLCSALVYLHSKSIMHRDLKPENMGFDIRGDIRLFDFGLAKELNVASNVGNMSLHQFSDLRYYTACCGSKRYMAPENFFGTPYNESIDIYSFTLVIWQLLHLEKPYQGMLPSDLTELVMKGGTRPSISEEAMGNSPAELSNILRSGWSEVGQDRPTAAQLFMRLKRFLSPASAETDESDAVMLDNLSSHSKRRSTIKQDRFSLSEESFFQGRTITDVVESFP